jgi:large subunit ribosomal protein L4
MTRPKTRELVGFLGTIEATGSVLLLTDGKNENVYLSARNIQGLTVRRFGDESVYDVLRAGTVVIERSALDKLATSDGSAAEEGDDA